MEESEISNADTHDQSTHHARAHTPNFGQKDDDRLIGADAGAAKASNEENDHRDLKTLRKGKGKDRDKIKKRAEKEDPHLVAWLIDGDEYGSRHRAEAIGRN